MNHQNQKVGRVIPKAPRLSVGSPLAADRIPYRPGASAGPTNHGSGGFTLVELMVAIGLIVVLAAAVSLALRREGNSGVALRAAQREVVAALQLAQRTAQARQTPVRLVVPVMAGPGELPEGSWRHWWLERAEGSAWVTLRTGGEFPTGTCVVPADMASLRLRTGVVWPAGLLSQLEAERTGDGGGMAWVEFRPDGSVAGGPRRIVLAVADEAPGQGPRLADPAAVRTVLILADGRVEEGEP